MRLAPNSYHCFLQHVLREVAIPHEAHANRKKEWGRPVVDRSKGCLVARCNSLEQVVQISGRLNLSRLTTCHEG
jgi:hypothetical protein